MSTKIYNAYIMEQDMTKFCDVLNELKAICREKLLENHYENIARMASLLIDECRIMKIRPNIMKRKYEDFDKHILDIYNKATINPQRVLKGIKPEDNIHSVMEKLAKYKHLNILHLMTNMAESLSEKAQIIGHPFGYNPKNELVVFPQNSRILFIVFGKRIEHIMADETNEPFLEKWHIRDYHYQNQTDMPEEVTETEWEQRRKDWDEAMPSGIPAVDGIAVTLTDIYDLERNTFTITPKDILEYIMPTEKRRERIATELTQIAACGSKTEPHEQITAFREAKDGIERKNGIWYAKYLDLLNIMEETVKEITEKDLENQITEILE